MSPHDDSLYMYKQKESDLNWFLLKEKWCISMRFDGVTARDRVSSTFVLYAWVGIIAMCRCVMKYFFFEVSSPGLLMCNVIYIQYWTTHPPRSLMYDDIASIVTSWYIAGFDHFFFLQDKIVNEYKDVAHNGRDARI